MARHKKLLLLILQGNSDRNISFNELCTLLLALGFKQRIKGSHHIFYREGVMEIINIQPDGSKAKPYQVKQVRSIIINNKLSDLQ